MRALAVGEIGQGAVLEVQHVPPAKVGEHPVDDDGQAFGLVAVEPDAQVVEEEIEAHGPDHVGADGRARDGAGLTLSQLEGPEEIRVAPGRRLRRIAELLEGVGAELPGVGVRGIGEDDVAHGLGDEAVLAPREVLARPPDHGPGAAHVLDVLLPALDRRQRVEVGGIGVVPADVPLIDRLRVVAQRPVVAARVPRGGEALRRGETLGDLGRLVAVVHEAHRLVVQVLVEITLLAEVVEHAPVVPHRPVVLGEDDLGVAPEPVDRLVQVPGPGVGVARLRPPDGIDVVQVVGRVLGEVQRPERGIEHVHLGRRLRLRRELEHDLDPVDAVHLDRRLDGARGRDEGDGAAGGDLAEAGVHLAARPLGQGGAELELRAPDHRRAREHGLRDDLLHEAVGRPDLDVARPDVAVADDAAHAAVMVGVAVRVDDRRHRPPSPVPGVEIEARPGDLGRDQRVDDDEPPLSLDEGHVRDVEAADLVDAIGDLEEAVMHVESGLAPEARVDRRRGMLVVEKAIVPEAPDDAALVVPDLDLGQAPQEAAPRILEVLCVAERERVQHGAVLRARDGRGVLRTLYGTSHRVLLWVACRDLRPPSGWGHAGRPIADSKTTAEDTALTFYRVKALAEARSPEDAFSPLARDRVRAPRLSEPWFC